MTPGGLGARVGPASNFASLTTDNVRYWHKVDIPAYVGLCPLSGGKADTSEALSTDSLLSDTNRKSVSKPTTLPRENWPYLLTVR